MVAMMSPAPCAPRLSVNRILTLLLLASAASFAQSPFDGTWMLEPQTRLPDKPVEYSLWHGTFRCSGCIVNVEVKADGLDHKFSETDYWDTVNVQSVDAHSLAIIAKKAGKPMFTEIDVISPDGGTLTQLVKDTTEAETVTVEALLRRHSNGAAEAHAISGSWIPYKITRSVNGAIIRYKCTPDALSGETPLGEKFTAKFDGQYYPVEDDPGHTLVAAKLVSANTIELTHKRKDKIVSTSRMTVTPDGRTIHVVFENKDSGTTNTFDFRKQENDPSAPFVPR